MKVLPFVSFPLLKAHLFFLLFLSRDSMGREEGLEEDVLSVLVVRGWEDEAPQSSSPSQR
jgi:hypothetical protein